MLLYLIRHGQSESQRLGTDAGPNTPLSELGWQQAEQLGLWLSQRGPFDALYCSPLRRACQTAEAIRRHVEAPPPVVLEALREAEFNMFKVLPQFEHPADVLDSPCLSPLPEEYQRFRRQIESAIRTILDAAIAHQHQQVLAISHGAALGTLMRVLVGCHHISIWSHNCCVHCLGWTDNRWEIRFMNRTDFLEDGRG